MSPGHITYTPGGIRLRKHLLLFVSIILSLALVIPVSAARNMPVDSQINSHDVEVASYDIDNDPYEIAYREAMNANQLEQQSSVREKRQLARIVMKLAEYVAKQLPDPKHYRSVTVKATSKNVTTTLSRHAVERMALRGITGRMVDNVLAEKSTGMLHVLKFDDITWNSRVMVDPNNKVAVVIDKYTNTVATVYHDNSDAITNRQHAGRWKFASWIFDHM